MSVNCFERVEILLKRAFSKRTVQEKAGVVYRLDCKDCDAKYVGETGRQVQDRMAEHKRDIEKKKPASKVFQHVQSS